MLYDFIYDYPLEYILDAYLFGCITQINDVNLISYPYLLDLILIKSGWQTPIDYSLLYDLEYILNIDELLWSHLWCDGHYDFTDNFLVLEIHKILDRDIILSHYIYNLFFLYSKNFNMYENHLQLYIYNSYISNINSFIYINLIYTL